MFTICNTFSSYIVVFLFVVKIAELQSTSENNPSAGYSDEDVDKLFDEYWKINLMLEPEFATSISVHIHNAYLTSHTLHSYEYRKGFRRQFIDRAKELVPRVQKGGAAYDNLQVFLSQLQYQLIYLETGYYLFPVTYLDGPQITMMDLTEYAPMKNAENARDLIFRYKAFPQQIEEIIDLMNEGIRRNMTLHFISLKKLDRDLSRFEVRPEESEFLVPFKKLESILSPDEYSYILDIASGAINKHVVTGFCRLRNYIKNVYQYHTRSDIGVSSMAGGTQYYKNILKFQATADVTVREIHALGKKEVRRIQGEMRKVIHSLGLRLTIPEFNDYMRNDTTQLFNSAEEVLEAYKDVLENKVPPLLPSFFKNIPKAKLEIRAAPDSMAGAPKAVYQIGTPDGSTPGTFYVELSSIEKHPKYQVTTVSLHEGIPGHHLQVSYSMEQKGVPDFRKYFQQPMNAFVEGWGLYSEYLGHEMGLFDDPYKKYGQMSEEIFRACRLVVDTGMHALGWTRERAIDYMLANSASVKANIENEIDRYITWPGQACSYKYGEVKIKELRKAAENGTNFDLKEFHDTVLRSMGPMSFVEQQVQNLIQQS